MKIINYSLLIIAFSGFMHPMDTPKAAFPKGISSPSAVNAQTMLFGAASAGNQSRVEQALIDGANPALADNQGYNALHLAARNGRHHIVEFLLNRYPNLNLLNSATTNNDGQTALHLAAINGHVSVVNELLRRTGIQAAAQDSSLSTPLHYAAAAGKLDIVKALLPSLNDDEVHLINAAGVTALDATRMMSQEQESIQNRAPQPSANPSYSARRNQEAQLQIPDQDVKNLDDRRRNTAHFLNPLIQRTINQAERELYQTIIQALWGAQDATIALNSAFEAVRNIYVLGQPSNTLRHNLEIITALIHGIPTQGIEAFAHAPESASGSGRQLPYAREDRHAASQPQQPTAPVATNAIVPAAAPKQPVLSAEAKITALNGVLEEQLLNAETDEIGVALYGSLIEITTTQEPNRALSGSISILETNLRRTNLSAQIRTTLNRIAGIIAPHLQTSNNQAISAPRAPQATPQANQPVDPARVLAALFTMAQLQQFLATKP